MPKQLWRCPLALCAGEFRWEPWAGGEWIGSPCCRGYRPGGAMTEHPHTLMTRVDETVPVEAPSEWWAGK